MILLQPAHQYHEQIEMVAKVHDRRAKIMKPPLRKVLQYEAKIERMLLNGRKEVGFSVALKLVKKDQLADTKEKKVHPEWSWKQRQQQQAEA